MSIPSLRTLCLEMTAAEKTLEGLSGKLPVDLTDCIKEGYRVTVQKTRTSFLFDLRNSTKEGNASGLDGVESEFLTTSFWISYDVTFFDLKQKIHEKFRSTYHAIGLVVADIASETQIVSWVSGCDSSPIEDSAELKGFIKPGASLQLEVRTFLKPR